MTQTMNDGTLFRNSLKPLMVASHYLISDLKRCHNKELKIIKYPEMENKDTWVTFGELQTKWIIILFDLPTATKESRKTTRHSENTC